MKFSAVVLALATSVAAWHDNVTYVTDVVTAVTTYCPYATTLVHNGHTYTVTEATTLTITNCPCTITRPVTVSSVVACNSCYSNSTAPPPYTATTPATIPAASSPSASYKPSPTSSTVTAGAGKAATLSGAGLVAVLGFAALL